MMEELTMKNDFESLIKKANVIQSMCKDDVIPVSDLTMTDDLKLNGMDLSTNATGQLCGKLGVPSRYFNKLVDANQNKLAAENINIWMKEDKRKFMLRQYNGHIRGVLSGSYSIYDAPEILESVQEVFGEKQFKLKGSFINEERLHVRLVENEMLPIDGEDLFAGITLDSSDIGRSGLAVRFFIYKQVCTNGLIIAKSNAKVFTQKHIGITHDEFKTGLEDGLKNFEAIKDGVIEMIENTHKIPVTADLETITDKIKDATKLSDEDIEQVTYLMASKYEPTQWGLINGITEVAQKFTLERRLELETIAGNMLA
jgi:hypothetical protein